MALYYMCIHRTIYDGCGSMEYRRYLQCIDGNPESDSLACTQQSHSKRNESIYGKAECGREESENSQRNECRECIIEYKFCRAYGDKIQGFWYKKQNPCIYFCPLILIEKICWMQNL